MSKIDKSCKIKILENFKNFRVANIEHICRANGISRPTANKYLAELAAEGNVFEIRCGNSRIFLPNTSCETRGA